MEPEALPHFCSSASEPGSTSGHLQGFDSSDTESDDAIDNITLLRRLLQERNAGQVRNLDIVEFFSGVGRIHSAAIRQGFQAAKFDVIDGASQNLLTTDGFLCALDLLWRLKRGGCLHKI